MAEQLNREEFVQLIRNTFPNLSISFRVTTRSWTFKGRPISTLSLVKMLALELETSNQRISNGMEWVVQDETQDAVDGVKKFFGHNDTLPQEDHELIKFLQLMQRPDTTHEIAEANLLAMKQWLWQVKRGVAGLKSRWQTALIFWSRENGTGKSFNVQRLLNPVKDFTRHINVDDLGERFSGQLFANTLVAFLDEFAGAEAINATNLKSILTHRPWDQRVIHSAEGFFSENRTSAIATSNIDPPHGYEDNTGARRIWSIHCDGTSMEKAPDRMKQFDSLDVSKIYASVRTLDPSPWEAAPARVQQTIDRIREERLRTKTSLESFLTEGTEEAPIDYKLTLKEFQMALLKYCSDTKQKATRGSYKSLAERLKELGQRVVCVGNRYYIRGRCLSSLDAT